MSTVYFCCKQNRRDALLDPGARADLNGIDFLEVLDGQRTLAVHFLKTLGAHPPEIGNVQIQGGERLPAGDPRRGFVVEKVEIDGSDAHVLRVRVSKPGDFSIYTLSLVSDAENSAPPAGFDPMLSAVDFSFKVECASDFDCKTQRTCPPKPRPTPDIDYLAKDYASFRQLMLDRMSALMPQWQERNAADLGVTLVELLAYVGDHLSYTQDAVATEAYLGTAQRRVSARRHARLVDYSMHDGCNARVWAQLAVDADTPGVPRGTPLLTASAAQAGRIAPRSPALDQAMRSEPEVFETMHDARLFAAHNQMNFYTWGDERCCLPKGATKATLAGNFPNLQKGDVLIFEEILGPLTGQPEDAVPTHRQAVRLSAAPVPGVDPLYGSSVTGIEWFDEDALTFPLCVSSVTDKEHGEQLLRNVSVALGNIVLADHGATVPEQPIGTVPDGILFRVEPVSGDRCQPPDPVPIPPRFRPRLPNAPLTMAAQAAVAGQPAGQAAAAFDPAAPATAAFAWKIGDALPAISLNAGSWQPRRDLLDSDFLAKDFVAEVAEDGFATLRFGDGKHGLRPAAGEEFTASYRVGNGARGNVGADSLVNVVSVEPAIRGVRNPLPAAGGTDPETIEQVRQSAPSAFRVQERAVTAADYAEMAGRHPGIQQAAATFRWTGSWRTVFLTVDRLGGREVDSGFKDELAAFMERYRMAGQDLEINGPLYVSLEIEMTICVRADYFRSDVEAALLERFSNRALSDGTRGVFHPDNFSFGQTVYLSPLYAAAMKVEGVAAVRITTFQRQASPDPKRLALTAGKLTLARLEIARLDNDPNFPERGALRLNMEDGK
jgi:hypothetical protein